MTERNILIFTIKYIWNNTTNFWSNYIIVPPPKITREVNELLGKIQNKHSRRKNERLHVSQVSANSFIKSPRSFLFGSVRRRRYFIFLEVMNKQTKNDIGFFLGGRRIRSYLIKNRLLYYPSATTSSFRMYSRKKYENLQLTTRKRIVIACTSTNLTYTTFGNTSRFRIDIFFQ